MANVVVSGRVSESVKRRADAYIRAAGLTVADVVRVVWDNIARTGEVPTACSDAESAETDDPWVRFMHVRGSLSDEPGWLADLSDENVRDMAATERERHYA